MSLGADSSEKRTGSALRNACLKITVRSGTPFARAVLTKSWLSESSIDQIAGGLLERRELDLPLDEPTRAAQHYIDLSPAEVEATFAKLRALPCDIFFSPHGGQFAMADKFARLERGEKGNPFVDVEGWKKLVSDAEKAFRDQLAKERSAQ